MKDTRLPVADLIVVGMLNLFALIFLVGHPERVPAASVAVYPAGSNAPALANRD
jgi:hypothetical protein